MVRMHFCSLITHQHCTTYRLKVLSSRIGGHHSRCIHLLLRYIGYPTTTHSFQLNPFSFVRRPYFCTSRMTASQISTTSVIPTYSNGDQSEMQHDSTLPPCVACVEAPVQQSKRKLSSLALEASPSSISPFPSPNKETHKRRSVEDDKIEDSPSLPQMNGSLPVSINPLPDQTIHQISVAFERETADECHTAKMASKRLGPKHHFALLMSYCGNGYRGMQTNENTKTIEGDLFKALIKIGCVSEENAVDQKKIGFQRAARTDKGVHAMGQVVNAKLVTQHLQQNFISMLNQALPKEIRVWDAIRVKKSFNSKNSCDSRIYSYFLPSYLLSPLENWAERLQMPVDTTKFTTLDPAQLHVDRDYRLPTEVWKRVVQLWKVYEGTHRFHNFTVTRALGTESSAQRYMLGCEVDAPVWIDGVGEWICLKVHGQSFMLHQIRKMVGLLVLAIKTHTPVEAFQRILAHIPKLCIPKAPSPGLWLEECVFQRYNEYRQERDPIDFQKHREAIGLFKEEFVYSSLFKQELEDKCFKVWIETVLRMPQLYSYLNPEGKIPEDYTAYIDFGQQRRDEDDA